VVKALIEGGAVVNKALVDDGRTPLFAACLKGQVEVVKTLLERGAAIDQATTCSGATPLYVACQEGHIEVVKALIEKGADVDKAGTDSKTTPLLIACQEGFVEITKLILKKSGASLNLPSFNMLRPIDAACYYGHEQCLSTLLAFNADFAAAYDKPSPGRIAHMRGHKGCVDILREWPAKRNQLTVKLCLSEMKRQGMYDTVNEVHVNELSPALFVFKVVEEMVSRNMFGLAEQVVACVGVGRKQTDNYSD
jgi:ankyrin repeat protein